MDAVLKTPETAGLALFRKNRRLTNDDFRILTDDSLSFDILRSDILRPDKEKRGFGYSYAALVARSRLPK